MTQENKELRYALTALADGEISNIAESSRLQAAIDSLPELAVEYEIQRAIKQTIKRKCAFHPCPDQTRAKILREIKKSPRKNTFQMLYPKFATAIAAAAVILIGFLINNTLNSSRNLLTDQRGEDNMIVQATLNFGSILAGHLIPQIVSSNTNKVLDFFTQNGVRYKAVIPTVKGCTLLGGVVSDNKGQKLAHHVYADPQGKLIYVFQADEAHFTNQKLLTVSEDLWEEISANKVYYSQKDNYSLAIFKNGTNISTVVSNQELSVLKEELSYYNINGVH